MISTKKGTFSLAAQHTREAVLLSSAEVLSQGHGDPSNQEKYCSYSSESTSLEGTKVVFSLISVGQLVGQLTPLSLSRVALVKQYLTSQSPAPLHFQTQQSTPSNANPTLVKPARFLPARKVFLCWRTPNKLLVPENSPRQLHACEKAELPLGQHAPRPWICLQVCFRGGRKACHWAQRSWQGCSWAANELQITPTFKRSLLKIKAN